MSEKTLYIEVFQPFAQYRNPFTFYYAQTYPLPPKSTIIGMLQNAVGDWYGSSKWYEFENKDGKILKNNKWWDDLKVSVHGGFESIFWNYQQLIKGELALGKIGLINRHKRNPLGNIWHPLYHSHITAQRTPVYQQELFNGHLFIFLRGDENLLDDVKHALKKPRKILYLGRSEDVIFIRHVDFVEPEDVFQEVTGDIRLRYPTYLKADNFPIKNQKYPVYSIPVKVIFKNNGVPVKHKAEITKETKRDVEFMRVIYTGTDYPIILDGDLGKDVELYKIGKRKFLIIEDYGWL